MVRFSRFFTLAVSCVSSFAAIAEAAVVARKPAISIDPTSDGLQNIVTWDEHSIFVRGERVLFYSGEFHPFRLPVATLYLDVFQKIRALGYTGVSFYVDWALLEGKPGEYLAEGVFDLKPFFDAAKEADIYLLARPGPYINAEASGGGFPGWLQRIPGYLRSSNASFLEATQNYVTNTGHIIAEAQITNGGPVILFQPENEYAGGDDGGYFAYVRDQWRKTGIVVPLINNDVSHSGRQAPGKPGGVNIYGHDGYPLGFDCGHPFTWPEGQLTAYMGDWHTKHLEFSPKTPYSIVEFQGGSFDPWGGPGFEQCAILLNMEFERVFYKEDFSFGVTIFNIYMTYGGTNWGNLGHPGGYTSYDYAAVIREDRMVDREKYSEAKLLANMLQASPAYITATPGNATNGTLASTAAITVTPLHDEKSGTRFYVVRHAVYNTLDTTDYKLTVDSSVGTITIPQLQGSLSLHGRDSKIHVVDYDVGGTKLLYSSAEIFTWKKYSSSTVLVVYGGPGELHEMAFKTNKKPSVLEGSGITFGSKKGAYILNFETSTSRRIVQVGSLFVYVLDRNSAYNYWTLKISDDSYAIVKAGYLLRTASLSYGTLALTGDFNATTEVEVIGAPSFSRLTINGKSVQSSYSKKHGSTSTTVQYQKATPKLPNLRTATWHYIDSLPEIQSSYSDADWTVADHTKTNNTHRKPVLTPKVLFSSDYGYHTGSLIYRGHFTANGEEKTLKLWTQGGSAYGMSAWLGDTFLGSWNGADYAEEWNSTFTLPNSIKKGKKYIFTVLIDVTGLEEDFTPADEQMKEPRGILDYSLSGHPKSAITWKLTGNLGGESYPDKTRGPLNEGALYAERQGYHLPSPPISSPGWKTVSGGPLKGITSPGVAFYTTSFSLDMPSGYDIPLSFTFNNGSATDAAGRSLAYRAILYVNGYQFGKYVHNVGPQDTYPVPEGILNYHGENWVAVALWALEKGGAKLTGLDLGADAVIVSALEPITNSPMPGWEKRAGAY
ncbi:beta-galactosidase [Rhizodiscina lignyota]|uniref:Beta-galactosidase n=1 Tax=Rhizodiscina lignyota TaxID=1504668 RepID=A0A9P4M2T5_9PEZI|nr:beta-galactosidase [Rhizodiscina lignyota]